MEHWLRSPSTPQKVVRRAQIVLRAADGLTNDQMIADGLGSAVTVGLWRRRFAELGIEGLKAIPKPGRPRTIDDKKVTEILSASLRKPTGLTHSSSREMAKQQGFANRRYRGCGVSTI